MSLCLPTSASVNNEIQTERPCPLSALERTFDMDHYGMDMDVFRPRYIMEHSWANYNT